MNSADFFCAFSSESVCLQHFKELRESQGITCKFCGCKHHRWLEKRRSWECRKCGLRIGIKSGTIMQFSKLSIMTWYHALYHIASTKKSMSAKELQRQLSMKRYEPVWYMRKKIQFAFRQQNKQHLLKGRLSVESMMQSLFNTRSIGKKHCKQFEKRNQVMLIPEEIESIRRRGHPELMLLVATGIPLTDMEQRIIESSPYRTRFCYKRLTRFGGYHFKEQKVRELPRGSWSEKVIHNAQRVLSGIHHLAQKKYLQFVLDEFTYKYINRGSPDIFSEALVSLVKGRW
ncbi:MAG: hypothetical protein NWR73_09245 [Flavobacteriales bacterium]|nr:hypothetical protein [Flavobacteriales bacterium]